MTALAEIERTIARVAEATLPSVVAIGRRFRGSGFIIADDQIVTNAHNLRGEETTVTFADGTRAVGRIAGIDVDGDLAVIGVATDGRPALAWADRPAGVGSAVLAAAAGPDGPRLSIGFVSGVGRSFRSPSGALVGPAIEHTAPLAPGASGGAPPRWRGAARRDRHAPARRRLLPRHRRRRRAPRAPRPAGQW